MTSNQTPWHITISSYQHFYIVSTVVTPTNNLEIAVEIPSAYIFVCNYINHCIISVFNNSTSRQQGSPPPSLLLIPSLHSELTSTLWERTVHPIKFATRMFSNPLENPNIHTKPENLSLAVRRPFGCIVDTLMSCGCTHASGEA